MDPLWKYRNKITLEIDWQWQAWLFFSSGKSGGETLESVRIPFCAKLESVRIHFPICAVSDNFRSEQFLTLSNPSSFWHFPSLMNSDTFEFSAILILSNSDTLWFCHFRIFSHSDTFQFWLFLILTLSNSDTFRRWHFPILTLSNSDTFLFCSKWAKNGFWHFLILTLSNLPWRRRSFHVILWHHVMLIEKVNRLRKARAQSCHVLQNQNQAETWIGTGSRYGSSVNRGTNSTGSSYLEDLVILCLAWPNIEKR